MPAISAARKRSRRKAAPATVACAIETSAGIFRATFSDQGLTRLEFPGSGKTAHHPGSVSSSAATRVEAWKRALAAAIESILMGKAPGKLPPIDVSAGTDFQRSVWRALQAIPPGRTRTYTEIAAAIRRHRAVRAVGQACGANPVALLIPCHRVVAANRKLGGFSGGLHWKRRLLAAEGFELPEE